MSSNITTLGKAVRDLLNGNQGSDGFSQDFDAVFAYSPQYKIPDTATLSVIVTDAGGEIEVATKRHFAYDDAIRIIFLFKVLDESGTGTDDDLVDQVLVLVDEVVKYLMRRPAAGYSHTGAIVRGDGEKDKQHYYPGNLAESVFASQLTLTYRKTVKELG